MVDPVFLTAIAAGAISATTIYIAVYGFPQSRTQEQKNAAAAQEQEAFAELRDTNPEEFYDRIIETQVETGQIGEGQSRCDELKQLAGRAASRGDFASFFSDKEYARSIGCDWAQDPMG